MNDSLKKTRDSKRTKDTNPLVSVTVLCFNFERFIGDCLESIVHQKTDFPFEIIVGDDCSNDSSRSIIEKYKRNFPSLVKTIYWSKNVGPKINMQKVLELSRGKLISHCDGDDYFLPGKLQAQVNMFKNHPECSIVFHDVFIIDGNGYRLGVKGNRSRKRISSIEDLVRLGNYITHSSKMYRKDSIPEGGFRFYKCARALDYYRNIASAKSGKIGHIPEPLGIYRKHVGGVDSSSIDSQWRNFYGNLRALREAECSGIDANALRTGYASVYFIFAHRYAKFGRYATAKKLIKKSVRIKTLGITQLVYLFAIQLPFILKLKDYFKNILIERRK